jgi:hypothetical protein
MLSARLRFFRSCTIGRWLQPVGVSMVGVLTAGVPIAGVPRVGVPRAGVLTAGVPPRVVPTVGRLAAGEIVLAGVLPPVGTPTGKISVLSSRFFFGFGSGAASTLSVVSSSQSHKSNRKTHPCHSPAHRICATA